MFWLTSQEKEFLFTFTKLQVAAQQETLKRITTRANNPFCTVILLQKHSDMLGQLGQNFALHASIWSEVLGPAWSLWGILKGILRSHSVLSGTLFTGNP